MTTTDNPATTDAGARLFEATRALAPDIATAADEVERERGLPAQLLQQLRDSTRRVSTGRSSGATRSAGLSRRTSLARIRSGCEP